MQRLLKHTIVTLTMALLLTACPQPRGEDLPLGDTRQGSDTAVQALMVDARSAYDNGQLQLAASYLERAARIDPQNPYVWSFMAEVRLAQGQYTQAIQFVTLSDSLTGEHDRELRARNREIRLKAQAALNSQP